MENAIAKQNTLKVYIYITILTLLITTFGHFLSRSFNLGLTGTGIFLILAGIIDFVAYFFSDKLILRVSGAKPLTYEMAPNYFDLVKELCIQINLPLPKLYLINEDAMNAFATGRDIKHAALAVTRGLLEKLTPEEVKGVVGHELAHIKNLDMRLMAIVSILAGLISILADMYWHSNLVSKASEKDRSGVMNIIGLLLALFAPITAMLIQLAISRQREFVADTDGAHIAGHSQGLISALEKISRDRIPLPTATYATAHLYLSNPFTGGGFLDKMMSTHPPVEERIERLKKLY
jgi:heat shock protein HtpX